MQTKLKAYCSHHTLSQHSKYNTPRAYVGKPTCFDTVFTGTISALADRFIIADKVKYHQLALSPQVILNCRAGGSCEGGNPGSVYEFVNEIGVPDMT